MRTGRLLVVLVTVTALSATSGALTGAAAAAQRTPQSTGGSRAEESRALALAIQLERSGQQDEAERVLIELLASQPTAAQALSMLARLTEARGAPDVVLPYAENAAEEAGYDQAAIHQVHIRALAASGLGDRALEAARAWVSRRPTDISGYAELSNTYATLGRLEEARQVLLDARRRTGDDDLFSQEVAVLYERDGSYDDAALEWLRVLAWGEAGVTAVESRLRTPGVDRDAVIAAIDSALTGASVGIGALRGGIDLALRLGRGESARRLAERFVSRAPGQSRWQVMRKYYVDARNAGYPEDARWAASRLAANATDDVDRLQWEAVEASLALELGDRAVAREAFERIFEAAPAGSDTRRLAINSLVVLRADDDDRAAEELIDLHAEEYPAAEAERADLAIRLSKARVRRGDVPAARRALNLAPRQPSDAAVASRLEAQRGHLALFEGQVSRAREHLVTAGRIPGGDPGERTEILLFLDVFSRADSSDVAELGRGIYALRADEDADPLQASVRRWAQRPGDPAVSAGLMRLAAGALERDGFPERAKDARQRLVGSFPDTPEATGALLALARAELPERPDAARRWLQQLIIDHSDSALAPVARRMLAEIDGQVPSGGSSGSPERSL